MCACALLLMRALGLDAVLQGLKGDSRRARQTASSFPVSN